MCQEHYDSVVRYAESIGDSSLKECLERLESRDRNLADRGEIELCYDRAPYSFLFRERFVDGRLGLVGGLLYHGNPDRSGAYTMDRENLWQTHT